MANAIVGAPNGQLPCILDRLGGSVFIPLPPRPTKTATVTHLARLRSVSIGVVRFEKKFGRQPVR